MSNTITILSAGPAMSLQDMGRPGYLAFGLTRGGAADIRALHEGAALLGQRPDLAAMEMVSMGGAFTFAKDTIVALTGARMAASVDGETLAWNASHHVPAGAKLVIGAAQAGTYGYLHVAGGFDVPLQMGSRGSHLNAGIGALLKVGDSLPIGQPGHPKSGYFLPQDNRFSGGAIRIVSSIQTGEFSDETLTRFAATPFKRDPRANRQGIRMDHEGDGFEAKGGLSIVSEVIVPGDIQVTGDGAPYVLMCESQTTGGYPRIGSVIPSDIPKVAQAPVGAPILFEFVTHQDAIALETHARAEIKALASRAEPLVRDPYDIADLLSYQLVGGAVSAMADPYET
jgi:allophanate hydrolase